MTDLEQSLLKALKTKVAGEVRPLLWRSSGLPTCTMDWVLKSLYGDDSNEFDARSRVTLDMGTAIHSTLQKHLGATGLLWGRWKHSIPSEGCPQILEQTGSLCKKCDQELTYVEWEFEAHPDYPSSHIDALFEDFEHTQDAFAVVDFKSTNTAKLEKIRKNPKDEIPETYWHQTASYVSRLEHEGFVISRVGIMFVDRGKPFAEGKIIFWRNNGPWIERLMSGNRERYQEYQRRMKCEDFDDMEQCRFCKDKSEGRFCQWAHICWSPYINQQIKDGHARNNPDKSRSTERTRTAV